MAARHIETTQDAGTRPLRHQRRRTAINRVSLSRPLALARRDELLPPVRTLLDYGCGRGSDVKILQQIGIAATGWDPAFFPDQPLRKADVVNLGFVINVIEDPIERAETLAHAFRFAKQLFIISARMSWERPPGRLIEHRDGIVTSSGTFQKFYEQEELRTWVDETLDVNSIAAAPGIFYVFADEKLAQSFLSRRFLRRTARPSVSVSKHLFEQYGDTLQPLIEFYAGHARLPSVDEFTPWSAALITTFGSLKRAFRIVTDATSTEQWDLVLLNRQRDLLVLAALAEFGRQPRFSDFPIAIRHDIRASFGSYKQLRAAAHPLLFAAGQPEAIGLAFQAAAVGKLTANALYVHTTALGGLPPVLRVYEGCAMKLAGSVEEANIVKLHRHKPVVSYLSYPRFDRDPHPALHRSTVVDLQRLKIRQRNYQTWSNPPILHRKDTFVDTDYRLFRCFKRLTKQEERAGLLNTGRPIGSRSEWASLLNHRGLELSGHRLISAPADQQVHQGSSKKT